MVDLTDIRLNRVRVNEVKLYLMNVICDFSNFCRYLLIDLIEIFGGINIS